MARVQGVKEKLHSPLYDAFFVPGVAGQAPAKKFSDVMTDPRAIRFFVDVQNKTRLETNLQAAGVLPSLNNFEARALRVVVSNPPCLIDPAAILDAGNKYCAGYEGNDDQRRHRSSSRRSRSSAANRARQLSSIVAELIYNSVTTLLVGEKTMIEMPTYFFPAGAGVSPGNGSVINHGEPDPMATFRFSEPVIIEPQQNFRVEIVFPRDVPKVRRRGGRPVAYLGRARRLPDARRSVTTYHTETAMRYLSESEAMQMSGIGEVGDIVQGSDGHLYEWVEGHRRPGQSGRIVEAAERLARAAQPLLQRALPIARKIAPFIPGGAAALTVAAPILRQAGVEGYGGIGALYEASDGTVYQMQGLSEQDELQGFLADEELQRPRGRTTSCAGSRKRRTARPVARRGAARPRGRRRASWSRADEDLHGVADTTSSAALATMATCRVSRR